MNLCLCNNKTHKDDNVQSLAIYLGHGKKNSAESKNFDPRPLVGTRERVGDGNCRIEGWYGLSVTWPEAVGLLSLNVPRLQDS